MAVYLNRRARYSKGTLKLRAPLKLKDGTEVRVTVTPIGATKRRRAKPRVKYPTRALPPDYLQDLVGIVSLGGDAVVDTEALYDSV